MKPAPSARHDPYLTVMTGSNRAGPLRIIHPLVIVHAYLATVEAG
jgi:hypothetical protein